jgi:hypothetical protein
MSREVVRAAADGLAWAALAVLVAAIAWPYGTRRRRPRTLRPHYWLGYLLGPAALAHGWFAMTGGEARGASAAGMSLATLALLPLAAQVVVGLTLRRAVGERRGPIRRWHLAIMAAVAVLVAGHLALVRW